MKEKINELRNEINRHNQLYYAGKEEIPNHQFDAMFRKLQELEAQYPEYFDPNSPTQRVGSERINTFPKAKHSAPVLSIRTIKTFDEINEKLREHGRLITETKYDGICASATYENGNLKKVLSRGNGFEGAIITDNNARTIISLPFFINHKGKIEIHGEILTTKRDFHQLKEQYPNPQAAAAAIMRFKKSSDVAKHKLHFIAHGIGDSEDQNMALIRKKLKHLGFKIPEGMEIKTLIQAKKAKEALIDHKLYPADGIVFKVIDPKEKTKLGHNRRYFNWAWAWKPTPVITARVIGIHWNVSHKGNLTPVALFEEPIQSNGNKVVKASLHNLDKILQLGLTSNALVNVKFTGNVPLITNVIEKEGEFIPPTHCPECGKPLSTSGKFIRCKNTFKCPAQKGDPFEKIKTYQNIDRTDGNWGIEHAIFAGNKLGLHVSRRTKGSPFLRIQYNSLNQLADFYYTIAAEKL